MLRKLLLFVLVVVVLACVGVVVVIALYPKEAQDVAEKAVKGEPIPILSRRPPPRPTPVPGTPTPIPTPETAPVARQIRVKADEYPFRLSNQITQPDGRMRITLDLQNKSGKLWPVAYVTMSSAYHPERSHYRLDNWKNGEVRSIDYVFPKEEMRERLRDLRVEDVSSVPPSESGLDEGTGNGGESPGALGLWTNLKEAAGVPPPPPEEIAAAKAETSPETAMALKKGTGLNINLEGLGEIDATQLETEGVTGTEQQARTAYNAAVKAASNAVASMKWLAQTLGSMPFDDAMADEGPGTEQLNLVRQSIDAYQDQAIRLQQIQTQTPTQSVELLIKTLEQTSETLLSYQQALERQIRAAKPEFRLVE